MNWDKLITTNPDFIWYDAGLAVHLYFREATNFPLGKKSYIYLNIKHIQTQSRDKIYYFLVYKQKTKEPMAYIYLRRGDSTDWISPAKAPFGGVQTHELCSSREVIFLLSCVENFVKNNGGKKIIIKTAPENYDIPEYLKLYECYNRSNYEPKDIAKNHDITVSNTPFEDIITSAERRRLKKCRKAGFITIPIPAINVSGVYGFVSTMKNHLGYSLSISLEDLKILFSTFPDDVKVFSVNDHNRIIAIAITVRVNRGILYNFLVADRPEYRSYSPIVALLEGIYKYCQSDRIRILDLGISLDHQGIEKPSLIRFKENMGGKPSLKITWQKTLDT